MGLQENVKPELQVKRTRHIGEVEGSVRCVLNKGLREVPQLLTPSANVS